MGEVHRVEITPNITGPDAPVKEQPQSTPQDAPKGQPAGQPAARPEYVPEQFWKDGKIDAEGLAKSYSELRKKQDSKPPATQPNGEQTPKTEDKPNGEQTPKAGEQAQAPSIPGITQDQSNKYLSELQSETGQLSETSYAELEKAGYPKAVVDNYIAGIKAQQTSAQAEVSALKQIAGGDEGYSAMADWMANNLSEAELSEYNEAVNSRVNSVRKLAVQGMYAKYQEANGTEPKLLSGNSNDPDRGDVFRSQAEVTRAMRDPRYKTDSAYRKDVEKKLSRSKV